MSFRSRWPRAVADVDAVSAEDGSLPLRGSMRARWRLLALAAGRPVSVFGLWDGDGVASVGRGGRGTDGGAVMNTSIEEWVSLPRGGER